MKISPSKRRNVVGAKIRLIRHKQKPLLTQTDLAAKMEVLGLPMDQSKIAKIEAGRREVLDYEVAVFAAVLKVPISELF